jgi:hypothetical protein
MASPIEVRTGQRQRLSLAQLEPWGLAGKRAGGEKISRHPLCTLGWLSPLSVILVLLQQLVTRAFTGILAD